MNVELFFWQPNVREHIQGEKYLKLDIDVSCVIEIFCCLANLYSQMRNYLLFTLNNTKVPNALIQLQNTKTKMYVSRYPSIFFTSNAYVYHVC